MKLNYIFIVRCSKARKLSCLIKDIHIFSFMDRIIFILLPIKETRSVNTICYNDKYQFGFYYPS